MKEQQLQQTLISQPLARRVRPDIPERLVQLAIRATLDIPVKLGIREPETLQGIQGIQDQQGIQGTQGLSEKLGTQDIRDTREQLAIRDTREQLVIRDTLGTQVQQTLMVFLPVQSVRILSICRLSLLKTLAMPQQPQSIALMRRLSSAL